MNVSSFIAKRYFTAKKSNNFIQILSWVSMIGVAIGTMALVIVLSVFNGLQHVLRTVYGTFDPDLKVEIAEGKNFTISEDELNAIRAIDGVAGVAQVIEENVVFSYQESQTVVRIKGISDEFLAHNQLDTVLVTGRVRFEERGKDFAVMGIGVAYKLGVLMESNSLEIEAIYPRKIRPGALMSANSLNRKRVFPAAIFQVEQSFDEKYVMTSLDFASDLTNFGDKRTSLEIYYAEGASESRVRAGLNQVLGVGFNILNGDEQHADLLRAVKIEKLFVYIALSFITAIASFNIFFCLSMLAIEKRKDVSVLFAFGADQKLIKRIFLKQGGIIALMGAIFGIGLGVVICWLQETYGLISMGMSSSLVQAYPVKLVWSDVALVGLSIAIITVLTSYRPALLASRIEPIKYLD
ncbi:FtsX-like permease family protein [Roseivirga pacifica]|uniref:FtsX-like permease family protein n=1 Tax=Roseivirga pacifica TaxID=1267423 RepID=UPI00227A6A50|nr:FtsX-like permease family protein [Roseivirga pacifica]